MHLTSVWPGMLIEKFVRHFIASRVHNICMGESNATVTPITPQSKGMTLMLTLIITLDGRSRVEVCEWNIDVRRISCLVLTSSYFVASF